MPVKAKRMPWQRMGRARRVIGWTTKKRLGQGRRPATGRRRRLSGRLAFAAWPFFLASLCSPSWSSSWTSLSPSCALRPLLRAARGRGLHHLVDQPVVVEEAQVLRWLVAAPSGQGAVTAAPLPQHVDHHDVPAAGTGGTGPFLPRRRRRSAHERGQLGRSRGELSSAGSTWKLWLSFSCTRLSHSLGESSRISSSGQGLRALPPGRACRPEREQGESTGGSHPRRQRRAP